MPETENCLREEILESVVRVCRRDEHVARLQLVPELRAQQGARHRHEADGGQLPGAADYARSVHYLTSYDVAKHYILMLIL